MGIPDRCNPRVWLRALYRVVLHWLTRNTKAEERAIAALRAEVPALLSEGPCNQPHAPSRSSASLPGRALPGDLAEPQQMRRGGCA